MSVGAGVIGDIYKLEERGSAMGIFFGVGASIDFYQRQRFTRTPGVVIRSCDRPIMWWDRDPLCILETFPVCTFRDGCSRHHSSHALVT